MKKQLLNFLLAGVLILHFAPVKAQRYVSEIFPSNSLTPNIQYGQNVSIITGSPVLGPLLMDVYQPAGVVDPLNARPLVIVLHTGSFLPPVINGQPTGGRRDSSIVEICKQLARRGYVAAAMSYRLGWKPDAVGTAGQDIRTGTLLNAVYRSIQDTKACVRWFRADADTGSNVFAVDTSKIILLGQGTGGYTAMAYATLNDPSEIGLSKFLSSTTDLTYGFVAGQPYVNQVVLGDFDGNGGIPQYNYSDNNPNQTSDIQFVVNLGGALGDSSWMEPGDAPLIGFHVVGDPFAPYGVGDVVVPTTGDFVVEVSGSQDAVRRADSLGNNNCMINAGFSDPLTQYANSVNGGLEGLYPFFTNPATQAGPWEWYDSTATVFYASFLPFPYNNYGGPAYSNSLLTNPDMSKAKALAYIDTIMNYSNPRIVACLGLSTGIQENLATITGVKLQPNPAENQIRVVVENKNELIRSVELTDVIGRTIFIQTSIDAYNLTINREALPSGIYLVKVGFDKGTVTLKALFR